MKSKKNQRRTRIIHSFPKKTEINALKIDSKTGEASFYHNGKEVFSNLVTVETIKERNNKNKPEKILSKQFEVPKAFNINTSIMLLKYDYVFAVDTNTLQMENSSKSFGVIVQGVFVKNDDSSIECLYKPIHVELVEDSPSNAEKIVIQRWIEDLAKDFDNNFYSTKIAIITDHDLDKIFSYNKQILPWRRGFYIPPNVDLIYASADAKHNLVSNYLIQRADRSSSELIRQYKAGIRDLSL